jgi:dTDP-4-dehydrorhamnose reductase
MISGRGLVARQLAQYENDERIHIFASGVSNSNETDTAAFAREYDALYALRKSKACLVYFSTCSIFDPSANSSNYVQHKLRIEELLSSQFYDYLLVRLPLLIGKTPNPFTFFNFMKNSLLNRLPIKVHANAWRYILDAEEISQYLPLLIKYRESNPRTINMAYDNASRVSDLLILLEDILEIEGIKEVVPRGSFYDFDRHPFIQLAERSGLLPDLSQYNRQVLKKYLQV